MKLLPAFLTIGGNTLISRILGFVRDILIAAALGAGAIADAFFIAFRFPNLFRRLFGEGAFNSAFVPMFARRLEGEGFETAADFANRIASILITILLVLTLLCELFMPVFVYLTAPGFSKDPEKFNLAVLMTRITFPYLFCMSLVAFFSGLLNSLGRFTAASAVPIVLNIILIAVLCLGFFLGWDKTPRAGILLSVGVFIAGFAQLFMLAYYAKKGGFHFIFKRPRIDGDVRRFWQLAVPGIIAGGITQINILIGSIIASMQPSAVSYLYYADRLYQLPLGIVGIAMGVALLPDLSRRLRANDEAGALDIQQKALEFAMLLTLPAAAALFVMGEPIVRVLFERGAFDMQASIATATALKAFAIGLPAFVLIKLLSPGFFAREDTKRPMHYAFISMVVNVVVSLALFPFLGYLGIAIATTIAGWVNALLLGVKLTDEGHFIMGAQVKWRLFVMCAGSAVMMVALWGLAIFAGNWLTPSNGLLISFGALFAVLMAGLVVYGLCALLFGAVKIAELKSQLRRG